MGLTPPLLGFSGVTPGVRERTASPCDSQEDAVSEESTGATGEREVFFEGMFFSD